MQKIVSLLLSGIAVLAPQPVNASEPIPADNFATTAAPFIAPHKTPKNAPNMRILYGIGSLSDNAGNASSPMPADTHKGNNDRDMPQADSVPSQEPDSAKSTFDYVKVLEVAGRFTELAVAMGAAIFAVPGDLPTTRRQR